MQVIVAKKSKRTVVSDFMVRDLYVISPESSHEDAVHLLHQAKTHCLIVANKHGKCLGVATSYDIARVDAELLQAAIRRASVYSIQHHQNQIQNQSVYEVCSPESIASSEATEQQRCLSVSSSADKKLATR